MLLWKARQTDIIRVHDVMSSCNFAIRLATWVVDLFFCRDVCDITSHIYASGCCALVRDLTSSLKFLSCHSAFLLCSEAQGWWWILNKKREKETCWGKWSWWISKEWRWWCPRRGRGDWKKTFYFQGWGSWGRFRFWHRGREKEKICKEVIKAIFQKGQQGWCEYLLCFPQLEQICRSCCKGFRIYVGSIAIC
jgi:hypothetical protein